MVSLINMGLEGKYNWVTIKQQKLKKRIMKYNWINFLKNVKENVGLFFLNIPERRNTCNLVDYLKGKIITLIN